MDLDDAGNVKMNRKGMSVAPASRDLPHFRIPERLKPLMPNATGADNLYCFTMGSGAFQDGPLAPGLDLKTDSPTHGVVTHGVVAPQRSVSLARFQSDLAATRDQWVIDEA